MTNRVGRTVRIKKRKFSFVIAPNESIDPHRMPRPTEPLIEGQGVLASYGMRSTAARLVHAKRLSAMKPVAMT
jgi:hypothetical protein